MGSIFPELTAPVSTDFERTVAILSVVVASNMLEARLFRYRLRVCEREHGS